MDTAIRQAQLKILEAFSKSSKTFALSGGTALELFYLKHRFSRDLDFFYISMKIFPLHEFLKNVPREQQRGIIQWYRSYSRQEFKLGVLDLDIYDRKFNVTFMIKHLDNEIKKFMDELLK